MGNKRLQTRQAIIDVSLKLFADDGLAGVSIRTIAKEAKVNVAAVNYHFGSKSNLYFEVIRYVFTECGRDLPEDFEKRVDEACSHAELSDLVKSLVNVKVDSFLEDSGGIERCKRLMMIRVFLNDELADKMMDEFRDEHELQVKLFRKVNPELTENQAQLAVLSMIGQLAFYIFGRIMVYSTMNTTNYSKTFIAELKQMILLNLTAPLKLNEMGGG